MSIAQETSPLMRALIARGYAELTPVQRDVTDDAAKGRDLLVSAQTGSGKTVAYGLALGETLLAGAERFDTPGRPLALVVAPTRELAMQVEREFAWLFQEAGGRIAPCVGGMDPRAERRRLESGAHVVVGTPGRLRDHIDRGALDLSGLQAVVLDEADEMLDLGFRENLEFILGAAPEERRTLLFSATLPPGIVAIARRFQRDALRIETRGETRAHADIEHRAVRVAPRQADEAVVNVLRQQDAAAAIVFCATREAVRRLHLKLSKRGFPAVLLSGELGQAERNRALEEIRDGRARVCVATDVAARGIDLANVELVIHAELPNDAEVFQHRSGRTGRAGRKGVSVLLATASRRRKAELLFRDAGVAFEWTAPPSAAEILARDEERLTADGAMTAPAGEGELAQARALLALNGPEAVAVALLRLHRARLPAPADLDDPGDWTQQTRPRASVRETAGRSRESFGDAVWFRLAVGRNQNADPKWLLPLICRRGGVTRAEIGAIRIFDRESKVAIAASAAEVFAATALGQAKGDVLITRADEPVPSRPAPDHAHPRRADRPVAERRPDRPAPAHRPVYEARPDGGYSPLDAGRTDQPRAKPKRPKPAGATPFQARPNQGKPVQGKPVHGKPPHAKPAHGKPAHGKPAHGAAATSHRAATHRKGWAKSPARAPGEKPRRRA